MFEYPVKLTKDSNGTWLLTIPDVPEAATFGDTKDEALMRGEEALEAALSFYVDAGRDLPRPSAKRRGQAAVRPSLIGTMKLGVYKAMRASHLRKTDLARRAGWTLVQVDRILDLTHQSRIDQLETAFAALGQRVNVEMVPA